MGSNAKRKTTMAKMQRETKLRQKRIEKAARKDAKRLAAASAEPPAEGSLHADEASSEPPLA